MADKLLSAVNAAHIRRYEKQGHRKIVTVDIDFSNAAVTSAQNEVVQAIPIPAGTMVHGVCAEVLTVEGAARNYAVGDGSSTSGFIPTTTANTLGKTHQVLALTEAAPNTVTGYTNGKFYAAADTIDVLAVTAGGLTTCKLRVEVDMTVYTAVN